MSQNVLPFRRLTSVFLLTLCCNSVVAAEPSGINDMRFAGTLSSSTSFDVLVLRGQAPEAFQPTDVGLPSTQAPGGEELFQRLLNLGTELPDREEVAAETGQPVQAISSLGVVTGGEIAALAGTETAGVLDRAASQHSDRSTPFQHLV